MSLGHYHRHLDGATSLGIYPLRPDGSLRWFAVDVDDRNPAPAQALYHALSTLALNRGIYIERSGGKDHHVIAFFSDWTPAAGGRRIAKVALREAGLPPTTEVFPKQDALTPDTPWGNYLNLPYFGGDNPEGRRMILNPSSLEPVPLGVWLEAVEPFPVEALSVVLAGLPGEPQGGYAQGAPPSTRRGAGGPAWSRRPQTKKRRRRSRTRTGSTLSDNVLNRWSRRRRSWRLAAWMTP